MRTSLLRPALFCAILFACNASEVVDTGSSTAPSSPDPSGDGEAGRDGAAGLPGEGPTDGGSGGTLDGQVPGPDVEPGDPHVQFIGRFDMKEAAGPKCAWPGCRIVARFEGTSISVALEEIDAPWMDGAPSEWDVSVDGVITKKLVMQQGRTTYPLASGLGPGAHVVELYKRSESQNGTTRFAGFDFEGGTLLAPPKRKARHLEIIGDSAAAGFGIEGVGMADAGDCPGADHGALWQNFRKSFGEKLGTMLDAEIHGTVYSGKGIAKNIWHPDHDTLPIMFLRTIPTLDVSPWDFSEWQPDAVVVMAGGNDFAVGKPYDEGPATLDAFIQAYRQFAETLRTKYPNAYLFLTVSPSVSDAEPAGRQTRTNVMAGVTTVTSERNAQGDAKVRWYAPAVSQPSEMTACNGHGDEGFHQRVAAELATMMRPHLGW